jgi:hypothetical protein
MGRKVEPINNVVVVSDTHCGCRVGLCPADGIRLDDGGRYGPSGLQRKLWGMWRHFWDEFVPEATRGEPFDVIHNGDAMDGQPHGSKTSISTNLVDQQRIAKACMEVPLSMSARRNYYHVRGTEAHVGKSGENEEELAETLRAKPNGEGQYARYDLWKEIGGTYLIHALHHVGATGSQAYEATAVHKELTEEFIEAARWSRKVPDVIVRSHRHRSIEITIPTQRATDRHETGVSRAVVTACWQGKTPFAWKIPGARLSTPQFGGVVIRAAHGELFVRHKVWTVERSKTE